MKHLAMAALLFLSGCAAVPYHTPRDVLTVRGNFQAVADCAYRSLSTTHADLDWAFFPSDAGVQVFVEDEFSRAWQIDFTATGERVTRAEIRTIFIGRNEFVAPVRAAITACAH